MKVVSIYLVFVDPAFKYPFLFKFQNRKVFRVMSFGSNIFIVNSLTLDPLVLGDQGWKYEFILMGKTQLFQ